VIDGFVILPGDSWLSTSNKLMIIVEDIVGKQTVCAKIDDYKMYTEVKCGVAGIKVIVQKSG